LTVIYNNTDSRNVCNYRVSHIQYIYDLPRYNFSHAVAQQFINYQHKKKA